MLGDEKRATVVGEMVLLRFRQMGEHDNSGTRRKLGKAWQGRHDSSMGHEGINLSYQREQLNAFKVSCLGARERSTTAYHL